MSTELDGRVAVVTGAGKGLGRAIATRFAEAGASVVVSGTPAEVAEAALFLASERSSWCTGSGLVLDGGMDASLL